MKTSNLFTTIRIAAAPIVLALFFIPSIFGGYIEAVLMCILLLVLSFAEFTDYLDGFFARKNKEVSDFGKLYDPFADILLHITTFCCCAAAGYMPVWILALILYREFAMMFLRMIAVKKGIAIAARMGGKAKTVLYVVSGLFSIAIETVKRLSLPIDVNSSALPIAATVLFVLSLIASYASFIDYIVHFIPVVCGEKK
ncbi:MAG: CDP-diacylglycerol--glycerol-3-phosphate 3-phosphatidyltransferase [Bacteroides sp.]|nr:CDP-diacylglycerol--glycerol-3-phosphate 3-phosphatidyltransferase [Prevotella sp.]MCM1408785.1 CDP-diacylglycerol--glycerol-3-phosphate 3-phosphatidyltransferase [Treponema brennaborense]MCM1470565.1 CDP-diacylglycerol--glycerol-3-phosphate 3-phosphatidyltransferase [Bacteroides sp.]